MMRIFLKKLLHSDSCYTCLYLSDNFVPFYVQKLSQFPFEVVKNVVMFFSLLTMLNAQYLIFIINFRYDKIMDINTYIIRWLYHYSFLKLLAISPVRILKYVLNFLVAEWISNVKKRTFFTQPTKPIVSLQDCIEAENKFLVMKMVIQENEICENFMTLAYFGRGLLRCAQKR